MKLELHHIEKAVRKQFIWTYDPKTRWATDPALNLGSKGLGATVFIGIAVQMGFTTTDIYDYIDLEKKDIESKLKAFKERMRDMLDRKLTGDNLEKHDMTWRMSLKKDMVISYLRHHYLQEYISSSQINF